MSPERGPTNLAASVRARLRNLARARGEEFQRVLSDFAIERLLYRLSTSRHADRFVLKGARLFRLWSHESHRATWDLDFLGRGANGVNDVVEDLRALCTINAPDGISFDPGSVRGEEIRVADEYAGVRVRLEAGLAGARIPMQVDVGFGDAIVPEPRRAEYPTLLDHPVPRPLAYPREAVVAEKLEAICSLGITTSRMKDFYDLHVLAASFDFAGTTLTEAVRATFARRHTPVPDTAPIALTRAFLAAPERDIQWRAFLRRSRLSGPPDAGALVDALQDFLVPVLRAASRGERLGMIWTAGGPWQTGTSASGGLSPCAYADAGET